MVASKKYILTVLCTVALCINVHADDITNNEQNRVISITKCKKIDFGLTINQENASPEERETALQLITDFCNNDINALSESLQEKTPNVSITIVLLNVEEDQEPISIDNANTEQEEGLYVYND